MSYQQIIYNRLRQKGISEAGALGILGNWECESNCEPNRVQGDYSPYRTVSKSYTQGVTNGSISRQTFGADQKGYGLAQWTFVTQDKTRGRKFDLYDYWKKSGKPLDDVNMQVDFALFEFQRDYSGDLATLKTITDIYEACQIVCKRFENPAVHNVGDRFEAAKRIKYQIDLNAWQSGATTETTETTQPTTQTTETSVYPAPALDDRLKLRVTDEHCAGWPEAHLVQAILIRRGYDLHVVDGVWDDEDVEEIKMFQRNHGLTADGIVGPKTWAELLKR